LVDVRFALFLTLGDRDFYYDILLSLTRRLYCCSVSRHGSLRSLGALAIVAAIVAHATQRCKAAAILQHLLIIFGRDRPH